MNLNDVEQIARNYDELTTYLYIESERVWQTYCTAKRRAYASQNNEFITRHYTYERLDFDEGKFVVVYENYSWGESDYIYFPIEWFFDEEFEQRIFDETVNAIIKRKLEADINAKKEADNRKSHELEQLKKLTEKYPEVANALQGNIPNVS